MNYTKGEWRVYTTQPEKDTPLQYKIVGKDGEICHVKQFGINSVETKANANLIAAAVNACASVNPDNPMAVVKSIKEMYEALSQALIDLAGLDRIEPSTEIAMRQAIKKAKAEGRE